MRVVEFSPKHPIILDGEIPIVFSHLSMPINPMFAVNPEKNKGQSPKKTLLKSPRISPIYWGFVVCLKRGAPNIVPYPVDK
jgi:hypothetical protein